MRTLDQQRAADALNRVKSLSGRSDSFRKSYRAYVDRLGPSIVMNGLGQALATECAAAGMSKTNDRERAHDELYKSLQGCLCRMPNGVYAGKNDLLLAIVNGGESRYVHAHSEALAWLTWHKKCCRASFPRDKVDTK